MARVVVIGGGVAGLASAARLSIKGHQVTVLEQSDRLGGLVQSYSRDGFTFELGPSKLTLPAVYRDLFLKTGASLEDSVDLVEIPDGTRYHWSDGSNALVPSVGGTNIARALDSSLGDTAGSDWRTLTQRAGEMWKIIRPELLEQQLTSVQELKQITSDRQMRKTLAPKSSLRKVTAKLVKDRRVRQLVEHYALAAGANPRTAPASFLTQPYIEQTFGTWWITGGLHKLVDALEARCLERGVEIRTGANVGMFRTENNKIVGVTQIDGTEIDADIVVWSGSAVHLSSACSKSDGAAISSRVPFDARPSSSVFTIMAAVQGTSEDMAHENVFLSRDPDKELKQLDRGELVTAPTIRVCIPTDASMHPPNQEAWTIQVTAPLHRPADSDKAWPGTNWQAPDTPEQYAELIFDQLEARGLNVRDRLLWHEIRTPADIKAETLTSGGSAFGGAPIGWQNTWLKPTIHTPINGLYLVGDSAQPGAGLDRVGMGAEILAETIGRAKRRSRRSSQGKG